MAMANNAPTGNSFKQINFTDLFREDPSEEDENDASLGFDTPECRLAFQSMTSDGLSPGSLEQLLSRLATEDE
jgi:hypothetical protein